MQALLNAIPTLEDARFLLRPVCEGDASNLVEVYGDKLALPFFNSDDRCGEIFYYPTKARMLQAIRAWMRAEASGEYVRLSIIDKPAAKAIGTVALMRHESFDALDGASILRLDLKSAYERADVLAEVLKLMLTRSRGLVITKVPFYALERRRAVETCGFAPCKRSLWGEEKQAYSGYWEIIL